MRLHRTLTPIVFNLFLLVWPALVHADYRAGAKAYTLGDYATAFKEWRPLAEQGDATAQYSLGTMYRHGQGVPQDDAQARGWYLKAAEQGYVFAQAALGLIYQHGQGVLQDYVQAHMWFNLTAAQGYKYALELRSIIAKHMTPEQIAEAQRLAREWMTQHQK